MTDDRHILVSYQTCEQIGNSPNGKDVVWTSDIRKELPIKLMKSEWGSETPITVSKLFVETAAKGSNRSALFVERDGKVVTWSWQEY